MSLSTIKKTTALTTSIFAALAASNPLILSSNPDSNVTVSEPAASANITCPVVNSTYTCGSTTFKIGCGIGYVNHDLSNVVSPTLNNCMDKCVQDGECVAVSMVSSRIGPYWYCKRCDC
jgi:hypothetical protein